VGRSLIPVHLELPVAISGLSARAGKPSEQVYFESQTHGRGQGSIYMYFIGEWVLSVYERKGGLVWNEERAGPRELGFQHYLVAGCRRNLD
jgi:hypothetical protein